ncbi:MAG: histidine--tRNA ligase [Acidobacteria bacterium]|nr:MAG: histidine--tRNA ligase [Acidobacteriota bacterium]
MSDTVKPRIFKGLQDLMPQQVLARQWMIDRVRAVYERYGFVPLETPAIEYLEVLTGSAAGEEAARSLFTVRNPDRIHSPGRDALGLRFDLTVPLARVVAQYRDLPRPFRRYQVATVWRADKPDPGRFREFTQFDLDSVGVASEVADAEIIAGMCDALAALGVDYRVRFSSRALLNLLLDYAEIPRRQGSDVFRVLDKLDKKGIDKVRLELQGGYRDESGDEVAGLGLAAAQVELIERFLAIRAPQREEVIGQLRELFSGLEHAAAEIDVVARIAGHLSALGYDDRQAALDLSIARGLAYYTGPVFEAVLADAPQFGSVFGGGRYDFLVERFSGQKVPATGASMGVDRLLAALEHLGRLPAKKATAAVLVTVFDRALESEYLAMTYELRRAGIPAELYLGSAGRVGKQLKYADACGIPLCVIVGPDEHQRQEVQIKDMGVGKRRSEQVQEREAWLEERPGQRRVPRSELVATVRRMLAVIAGEER